MRTNIIDLTELSIAELAKVHNAIPGATRVNRFSDKKAAMRRIKNMAAAANIHTVTPDPEILQLNPDWEFDVAKFKFTPAKSKAEPKAKKAKKAKAKAEPVAGKSKLKGSRVGVVEFMTARLMAGDDDLEQIAKDVRKTFPGSTAQKAQVSWVRWKLRKAGQL